MAESEREQRRGNHGDVTTDETGLTDKEVEQLGVRSGRGDRPVAGAEANEDYISGHVQRDSDGGSASDLLDPDEGPREVRNS